MFATQIQIINIIPKNFLTSSQSVTGGSLKFDEQYDLVDNIDNNEVVGLAVMFEYVLVDVVAALTSLAIFFDSDDKNSMLPI